MLSHERTGSGPPLLLLHGIGMRWQWWAPCLPALAQRFDVAAVDFPGFGAAPALTAEPTIDALTDAIAAFADELGWERPAVAGISLGGLVGLELAKRGRVASTLALSPAGFATGWERTWLRRSLLAAAAVTRALAPVAGPATATTLGRAGVLGQMVVRPGRIPADEAAGHLRAAADCDILRAIPYVTAADFSADAGLAAPATIAWGTGDRLLFPRQGERALATPSGRGARPARRLRAHRDV